MRRSRFRAWINKNDGKVYRLPENPNLTPLEIFAYVAFLLAMVILVVAAKIGIPTSQYAVGLLATWILVILVGVTTDHDDQKGGAD